MNVRVYVQRSAELSMTNQTFNLKFDYNGCTLSLEHSDVGVVHPLLLGSLLNFIINKVFVPVRQRKYISSIRNTWICVDGCRRKLTQRFHARQAVNAAVAGGFELPPLGGVTLSNSQVTLANAYKQAETVRGEGDGKASEIYAKAYGQDPEFYSFYRSLNVYRDSFSSGSDLLVLEPNGPFFKYFRGGTQ